MALSLVAHRGWLRPGVIAFGDWYFLAGDTASDLFGAPKAWDGSVDFGVPNSSLQGYPYLAVVGTLARLGLDNEVSQRLVFFYPFVVVPFASMWALTRRFTQEPIAAATSSSLYALNTYALMVGNNQLTVAMAYALAPWIVARSIDLASSIKIDPLRRVVANGGVLTTAIVASAIYEPRITLLGVVAAGGAFVATTTRVGVNLTRATAVLVVAGGILLATQLYWLLAGFGGSGYVGELLPENPFVSFASITHALNLNHPFWRSGPPGIFTREDPLLVLFLLPALVFSALVIVARRDVRLASFGLLAILGAFLVKGENPPFPRFYGWVFDVVPGMRMYRDMSKFALWTALGYALLLGVLSGIVLLRLRSGQRRHRWKLGVVLGMVAAVVIIPALPALTQRQGGTFADADYPSALRDVHELLDEEESFGRVVWIGVDQPISYRTRRHPNVGLGAATRAVGSEVTSQLLTREGVDELARRGVGYIVVGQSLGPWAGGTAQAQRQTKARAVLGLEQLSRRRLNRDGISLHQLVNAEPLWTLTETCDDGSGVVVATARSTPATLHVDLGVPRPSLAVTFRQAFDPGWSLHGASATAVSQHRTREGFNCFQIQGSINGTVDVRAAFAGDQRAGLAGIVSLSVTMLVLLGTITLIWVDRRSRKRTDLLPSDLVS